MSAPYHKDDKQMREALSKLNLIDTPLEERFERITRMVCMMLGVPISAFSLIDGERQWFKSIRGLDATENTRDVSFCAYTILGDDVMVVPDAKNDPRFSHMALVRKDPNISFYAGCPVRAPDGRNIGSLCAIDTKKRTMTAEQIEILRSLALMLESELKVAQLSKSQYELINELDAAKRLVLTDALTRLWNRAGLENIIGREWSFAKNNNKPIAFILADIDSFAKINESHGRDNGNIILKEIAKRFLKAIRPEDTVGRFDGQEFMIVIPGCTPEMIEETAERIRHEVTSEAFEINRQSVRIEMSFGAASGMAIAGARSDDLLRAADEAMRSAKVKGRNRTEVSGI